MVYSIALWNGISGVALLNPYFCLYHSQCVCLFWIYGRREVLLRSVRPVRTL